MKINPVIDGILKSASSGWTAFFWVVFVICVLIAKFA